MDILEKYNKDQKKIHALFCLIPLVVGGVMAYIMILDVGYESTTEFYWTLLITTTFFSLFLFLVFGVTVHLKGLTELDEYVIIEHCVCGKIDYTVHQIVMWGPLVWELEGKKEHHIYDKILRFDSITECEMYISEERDRIQNNMKKYLCEQQRTKKFISRG